MRQAKQAGTGRYALFEQDMPQATESRLALEAELRRAVANQEFALRYQPIFDIESRATTGVEALVRWERPDGRILPPDYFLTPLERAGLIDELGRWVVHEACRQGAELHRRGRSISMFVNVAASQLETDALVSDVSDALAASGLDPHALVVEVAEMSLLRNTDVVPDRLSSLKALGVRIAVDDFGTGFSSLAYLRRLPIDILKIERSFIDSMSTPAESSMIMHTLVEFGQSLGLDVIAEGIEHEGQLDPLRAANCELGQGFLYGRPMTPIQLDLFLTMHDPARAALWVVPPG
jgi:EAL domain-containing protein (putative c-di-GMP-specific phosphodiesterase class I)